MIWCEKELRKVYAWECGKLGCKDWVGNGGVCFGHSGGTN